MRRSIVAVGIAAATESTVCSGVSSGADLAEQRLDVLRLHGEHDEPGARDRLGVRERRLDAVALAQLGGALLAARGRDDLVGSRQPELSRPASSDSPIFPQPRIATRLLMRGV